MTWAQPCDLIWLTECGLKSQWASSYVLRGIVCLHLLPSAFHLSIRRASPEPQNSHLSSKSEPDLQQTGKLIYTHSIKQRYPVKHSLHQGVANYGPGVKSSLLFVFVWLTAKNGFCICKEFLSKKEVCDRNHIWIAKSNMFTLWHLKRKSLLTLDLDYHHPANQQNMSDPLWDQQSCPCQLPVMKEVGACNYFAALLWWKLSDRNENMHGPSLHGACLLVNETEHY